MRPRRGVLRALLYVSALVLCRGHLKSPPSTHTTTASGEIALEDGSTSGMPDEDVLPPQTAPTKPTVFSVGKSDQAYKDSPSVSFSDETDEYVPPPPIYREEYKTLYKNDSHRTQEMTKASGDVFTYVELFSSSPRKLHAEDISRMLEENLPARSPTKPTLFLDNYQDRSSEDNREVSSTESSPKKLPPTSVSSVSSGSPLPEVESSAALYSSSEAFSSSPQRSSGYSAAQERTSYTDTPFDRYFGEKRSEVIIPKGKKLYNAGDVPNNLGRDYSQNTLFSGNLSASAEAARQVQRPPVDEGQDEGGGGRRAWAPGRGGRGRSQRAPGEADPAPAPPLDFPDLPPGEGFRVNQLGLSDGVFMFKYLGAFLSMIQPYDFPVELLRDALWKRVSVASLITQSLPVEAGFLACLSLGVLLALALPLYALGHACCSLCSRRPPPPPPSSSTTGWSPEDDCGEGGNGCRRRALLFVLDLVLLLMVVGVVAMFVTNEQLSAAVARSPAVLHTALADAAAFLRNTNLQLHFLVTKSLDRAVEAASNDLDDVENLLGRPIQRELEEETGVGVALDALVDVTSGAQAVASLVASLLERAGEARGLAVVAQERLSDLRHQVEMLRRQCPAKDRALCGTVDASGLIVTLNLDLVLSDERLGVLRRLAEGNLSSTAQQARGEFHFIPTHVEQQTRDARSGIRRQLLRQRGLLDDQVWALDALTRDLSARVEEAREKSLRLVEAAGDLEYWRYVAAAGAAAAVLLLWTLLLGALSCGCCGAEDKARPTLFAWVAVTSPLYLALWGAALAALLAGGHGEVFVCRPLFDEPSFDALTALVDRPGVLFPRRGGFFSNLLYGNDSLDVPLRDVLRACEQNRPSYAAFRLHQVLDVDVATDHRRWDQLHRQLGRLDVDLAQLHLLTPALQLQLAGLLNAALVNLTSHRSQLSSSVTGKDLTAFADQLESVANQLTDLETAQRMETLASRTRRLLSSHVQPLKDRKEDLVYQLTALEVQLVPLQRQVNQSLSHLKTIQFFINNQGANISHTKSREYAGRLVSYVQQYRDHVLQATGEHVAPCRPVWDLFHAVRQLLCRHFMDPLNGFWFGAVWCLLLLLLAAPLSIKLAESYPRPPSAPLIHRPDPLPPEAPAMPSSAWSTRRENGHHRIASI